MDDRETAHQESIEVLEDKVDALKRVAKTAQSIDSNPQRRAMGEQIEIEAESEIGATEMAIETLREAE